MTERTKSGFQETLKGRQQIGESQVFRNGLSLEVKNNNQLLVIPGPNPDYVETNISHLFI